MKKSTMTVKWKDLIEDKANLPHMPDGYSTILMIAERTKTNKRQVQETLKQARDEGRIEAIRAIDKAGRVTWFYKD